MPSPGIKVILCVLPSTVFLPTSQRGFQSLVPAVLSPKFTS
jgi:hypothetical protein